MSRGNQPESSPTATTTPPGTRRRSRRRAGAAAARETHLEAWRRARASVLRSTRQDASKRVRRDGAFPTVRDAIAALSDPAADPWRPVFEALCCAAKEGSTSAVLQAASRGARQAAGDVARAGRHAPDPQLAVAAAIAFQVIGLTPVCLLALPPYRLRAGAKRL
jgi:hypothetical protein